MATKKSARTTRARVRRKTALQLRAQGLTFEAIGVRLGVSKQAAQKSYNVAMAALADETKADAEHLRTLELVRLDEIQAGLHPKSAKGSHLAAAAEMKVMERRARLLGLDAPKNLELSGPNGGPVEMMARVVMLPPLDAPPTSDSAAGALAPEPGPSNPVPGE